MTVYGWDASNHDWQRGSMNLAIARGQGISFFTHKMTDGLHGYHDPYFAEAMRRAVAARIPAVGPYHVLHGAVDPIGQADWYLETLTADFPRWKNHPCIIHQIDAEPFNYMPRTANLAEIKAYAGRLVSRGVPASSIVVYGPNWVYGDSLQGLPYRLWSSNYTHGAGRFGYPGDSGPGWSSYAGQAPLVWQFSSSVNIAGQGPCDINAIRVANEAAMVALLRGKKPQPPAPPTTEEDMYLVNDSNSAPEKWVLISGGDAYVLESEDANDYGALGILRKSLPTARYGHIRQRAVPIASATSSTVVKLQSQVNDLKAQLDTLVAQKPKA